MFENWLTVWTMDTQTIFIPRVPERCIPLLTNQRLLKPSTHNAIVLTSVFGK